MDKDFVRDQNPTPLYHAEQAMGLPDYVKQANFLTPEDLEHLHSSAFADRIHKLHPIHTKVAALLSGVYLAGNGEDEGPIWDSVKSACEFYGVTKDLEDLTTSFANTKQASTEDDVLEKWAVHVKWEEEQIGHYYPLNNAVEVKEAAVNLDQDFNRDRIPVELFRMGATNVVKAAAEFGVPDNALPATIKTAGTRRLPNLDYADLMLYTRKEAGVPDEGIELYKQCVTIAKEAGTDEAVEQAVSLWRDLDEKHGLSYRKQANGDQLPTPYDCFYTGMTYDELEKTAEEHVVLCGVMIPKTEFEFATIPNNYEAIRREFNKEAAETVVSALSHLGHYPEMEKAAVDTSNSLGSLEDWQQKRLLGIVSNFHKKAGQMAVGTGSSMGTPTAGGGIKVQTQPQAPAPAPIGHGSQMVQTGQAPPPVQTQPQPQAPIPIGHGNQMAQPGQDVTVQTQPDPDAPIPIGHGDQVAQPGQDVTVQAQMNWDDQFRKYHGGAYDPNSSMDRGKLEQMKQLYAQHGKLDPGLVYGAQYG